MARTYRECPACGKRALSIATRCPACGHELLTQPVRRLESGREAGARRALPVLTMSLAAMGVLVAAGLFALASRPHADSGREVPVTASAPAEPPVVLDSATAAASPATPDSAPSADAVPRYARTWTRVRDGRSVKAELVAVLLPGDTVLTDSLERGWWRVALEGRVLGYVSAATLTP